MICSMLLSSLLWLECPFMLCWRMGKMDKISIRIFSTYRRSTLVLLLFWIISVTSRVDFVPKWSNVIDTSIILAAHWRRTLERKHISVILEEKRIKREFASKQIIAEPTISQLFHRCYFSGSCVCVCVRQFRIFYSAFILWIYIGSVWTCVSVWIKAYAAISLS